jgi:5-methylcytosine-specific restriction endonuclease McrA
MEEKGRPVGQCVLCENTITAETESEEHLIPNALGGRKKVSGFLCRDCNRGIPTQESPATSESSPPESL